MDIYDVVALLLVPAILMSWPAWRFLRLVLAVRSVTLTDFSAIRYVPAGPESIPDEALKEFASLTLPALGFTPLGVLTALSSGMLHDLSQMWVDESHTILVQACFAQKTVDSRSLKILSIDTQSALPGGLQSVSVSSSCHTLSSSDRPGTQTYRLPCINLPTMLRVHRRQRAQIAVPRRVNTLWEAASSMDRELADQWAWLLATGRLKRSRHGRVRRAWRSCCWEAWHSRRETIDLHHWWLARRAQRAYDGWPAVPGSPAGQGLAA